MAYQNSPPPPAPQTESRTSASGCLSGARGVLLIAGAVGIGILGWVVLNILESDLGREPEHRRAIGGFSRWMIANRVIVPIAVLPAAIAGFWLLMRRSGSSTAKRAVPWMVVAFGSLWLALVFAAVLIAFVQFMAPLYQYQDLG